MMRYLLIVLTCCVSLGKMFAQPSLLNMQEIPLKNELTYYQFFHGKGDMYSLLVREIHDVGKNPVLRYYGINHELKVVKQSFYPLDENTEVVMARQNLEHIYILLQINKEKYKLLVLNKTDADFELSLATVPIDIRIDEMLATEHALFVGGSLKGKATAYKMPFKSKDFQVLFHHFNEHIKIEKLQFHESAGVVSYLLASGPSHEPSAYLINQYKSNGELLYNVKVTIPVNYRISDTKLTITDKKNALLVGTYSLAINAEDNIMGLYSINLHERDIVNAHFYNLGRVENFFTYLPQNKVEKQKKRIDKASAKMRTIKTNLYVELDELELVGNRILLKGSSFIKAKSHDRSYTFEYLNTFLAGFDFKGRLLWNNTITYPNENLKTTSPFLLTEAGLLNGNIFFIQKQQFIYRSKISQASTYHDQIEETFIYDGFLDIAIKNHFYEEHLELTSDKNLLYFGVRESTPLKDLTNSDLTFFIELLEPHPSMLFSKGEN